MSEYNARKLYWVNATAVAQAKIAFRSCCQQDRLPYSDEELRIETMNDIETCFKNAARSVTLPYITALFPGIVSAAMLAWAINQAAKAGVSPIGLSLLTTFELALFSYAASIIIKPMVGSFKAWGRQRDQKGNFDPHAAGQRAVYELAQKNVDRHLKSLTRASHLSMTVFS